MCSVHLQTQMLEQLLAYIEEVLEIFNLQQLYTKFSKCKSVRKGLTELCSPESATLASSLMGEASHLASKLKSSWRAMPS